VTSEGEKEGRAEGEQWSVLKRKTEGKRFCNKHRFSAWKRLKNRQAVKFSNHAEKAPPQGKAGKEPGKKFHRKGVKQGKKSTLRRIRTVVSSTWGEQKKQHPGKGRAREKGRRIPRPHLGGGNGELLSFCKECQLQEGDRDRPPQSSRLITAHAEN